MHVGRKIVRAMGICLAGAALAASGTVPGTPAARHGKLPAGRAAIMIYPSVRFAGPRLTAFPTGGYTPAQIRAAYFVNPLPHAGINRRRPPIRTVGRCRSPTVPRAPGVVERHLK